MVIMKHTYVTKVTKRQSLNIPKAVYDLFGLKPGQYVRITLDTEVKDDA